jgi:ABC-type branched-subunit amino acid transport system ATPase component
VRGDGGYPGATFMPPRAGPRDAEFRFRDLGYEELRWLSGRGGRVRPGAIYNFVVRRLCEILPRLFRRVPALSRSSAGSASRTLDRIFATFPKLRPLKDARGGNLSGGELQMLAIARALMGNVDLLLLDEPFEGLAPAVVEDVWWKVLREIRGQTTVLLVEQNADLALGLSDRAYVINNGSIAWRGDARALQADPGLRQRLLGV